MRSASHSEGRREGGERVERVDVVRACSPHSNDPVVVVRSASFVVVVEVAVVVDV